VKTENDFDMALEVTDFFVVQTPFGERLTRDGAFTLNANNELVDMQGNRVMGKNGPIKINGGRLVVDDGEPFPRE